MTRVGADRIRVTVGSWLSIHLKPLASTPVGQLYENLADFRSMASGEATHVADLVARVAPAPVLRVPFLPTDVHDLAGLEHIGSYVFAPS